MILPTGNRVFLFLDKYKLHVLSALLALYVLPVLPYSHAGVGMDDSWKRAINAAVCNGLVFGKDFIFTYGPLGFIDTRFHHCIHDGYIIVSDIFLVAGYYWLLYKYLIRGNWWLPVVIISLLFLKETNYCQKLLLVFTAFCCAGIQHNFKNYFEIIYCSLAAAIVFYVKFNYGLVFVFFIAISLAFSFFKNIAAFLVLLLSFSGFIYVIGVNENISFAAYVANSLEITRYYMEAMNRNLDFLDYPLFTAFLFTMLFIVISGYYLTTIKTQKLSYYTPLLLLTLCFFFLFKSSFTRADHYHYLVYHITIPFFMVIVVFFLGLETKRGFQGMVVLACVLSLIMVNWEQNRGLREIDFQSGLKYALPFNYFFHINDKQAEFPIDITQTKISSGLRDTLGRSSIDVIPTDISFVLLNDLNYQPRPIPQSYSAYSLKLDTINASHFNRTTRPAFIFLSNEAICKGYPFWDESITKAAIRLHYTVANPSLRNYLCDYMLLQARSNAAQRPSFKKIGDTVVRLGDKINIHFKDDIPVYMSAEMEFNLPGKLAKTLFNFPNQQVRLFFDDGRDTVFSTSPAIIKIPVLINKSAITNDEFCNFFTGALKKNKNITAFMFKDLYCFKPEMKITFYAFTNY